MKTMHLFIFLASVAGAAAAQVPISADGQVPEALRNRPAATPTSGAALRAQALAKLEAQFRAADTNANGSLTPEEAKGFGFVAMHFSEIDATGRGAVSFAELRAYLAKVKADRR